MANPTKFSWTDPSTNTDGTAVSAGELVSYTIGVGTATGVYTILTTVSPGSATSEALSSLTTVLVPGTYFAAIKANTSTASSVWSNEVSFSLAAPVPNAPTGFSVA